MLSRVCFSVRVLRWEALLSYFLYFLERQLYAFGVCVISSGGETKKNYGGDFGDVDAWRMQVKAGRSDVEIRSTIAEAICATTLPRGFILV